MMHSLLRTWIAGVAVFGLLATAGCKPQTPTTVTGGPGTGSPSTHSPTGSRRPPDSTPAPSEQGTPPGDTSGQTPTLSAVELTETLNKNEEAAARYRGKAVRIEGVVDSVQLKSGGEGAASADLRGASAGADADKHCRVACTISDKADADKLGTGQKVTVQGTLLGVFSKMVMIDKARVITAGPVRITQAEIERLRKEEPKAVAALEKLGVKCSKSGFGEASYEITLTDKELTPAGEIKPEVLEPLTHLVGLHELGLLDTRISDAGLAGLKKLRHLSALNLYRTKIGDAGLAHLKDVPGLHWLAISNRHTPGSPITDAGLAHLKGMELESIELAGSKVTDAGLQSLAGMPKLTFLRLPLTQITGSGLKHLAGLKKLEALDLFECPVTDAGLEAIATLPKLEQLDLSGSKVGDGGMASLAKSPSLKELDLSSTAVGDAGLAHLAGLKTLKVLTLSEKGKATAEGIKKLKAALPELKVSLTK